MKQYPSKLKYKKNHKIRVSNLYLIDQKLFFVEKGNYGLKVCSGGFLNFKQIEACRKAIRRTLKKTGLIYVKVFTGFSKTKKSVGSRMGTGKGSHSIWVSYIRSGQIIIEIANVSSYLAQKALCNAASKLPVKAIPVNLLY